MGVFEAIGSEKIVSGRELSSEHEDTLQNALVSVVLTAFPNNERKGCPGSETLPAIAQKTLPMRDPAAAHIARCSPCFSELREIQSRMRRDRAALLTSTAASILVAVALVAYNAF